MNAIEHVRDLQDLVLLGKEPEIKDQLYLPQDHSLPFLVLFSWTSSAELRKSTDTIVRRSLVTRLTQIVELWKICYEMSSALALMLFEERRQTESTFMHRRAKLFNKDSCYQRVECNIMKIRRPCSLQAVSPPPSFPSYLSGICGRGKRMKGEAIGRRTTLRFSRRGRLVLGLEQTMAFHADQLI